MPKTEFILKVQSEGRSGYILAMKGNYRLFQDSLYQGMVKDSDFAALLMEPIMRFGKHLNKKSKTKSNGKRIKKGVGKKPSSKTRKN